MITDRKPTEIMEQCMPSVDEPVVCLNCRHEWIVVRPLGWQGKPKCPFCGQRDTELEREANLAPETQH